MRDPQVTFSVEQIVSEPESQYVGFREVAQQVSLDKKAALFLGLLTKYIMLLNYDHTDSKGNIVLQLGLSIEGKDSGCLHSIYMFWNKLHQAAINSYVKKISGMMRDYLIAHNLTSSKVQLLSDVRLLVLCMTSLVIVDILSRNKFKLEYVYTEFTVFVEFASDVINHMTQDQSTFFNHIDQSNGKAFANLFFKVTAEAMIARKMAAISYYRKDVALYDRIYIPDVIRKHSKGARDHHGSSNEERIEYMKEQIDLKLQAIKGLIIDRCSGSNSTGIILIVKHFQSTNCLDGDKVFAFMMSQARIRKAHAEKFFKLPSLKGRHHNVTKLYDLILQVPDVCDRSLRRLELSLGKRLAAIEVILKFVGDPGTRFLHAEDKKIRKQYSACSP